MQREDLNRFLQTVRKTRLVDYLEAEVGESPEQALDRRLRWAARSRNSSEHAAEAAFLLQHGDALRGHLKETASDDVEDEWIDFGGVDDEDDDYGRVSLYKSSGANESIDLDELLGGSPASTAPQPVLDDNVDEIHDDEAQYLDRAPTAPVVGARSIRPAVTTRGRTTSPAPTERLGGPRGKGRQRTPSALLERARRNSPVPHLGRIGGARSRNPGTPSPPLLGRRARSDARASSGGPIPRLATPPSVPSRPPTYGAPTTGHLGSSATPAPLRGRSPAPATPRSPTPGGFDVRITGHTNFLRNNDQYGTSEVVYESEMHSGGPLRTPMPARTPSSGQRLDGPEGSDILGSLRGNVRRGGNPAQANGSIATKPPGIPPLVFLIPITAVVAIICTYLILLSQGWVVNPLADPPVVNEAPSDGDAFDQPATIAPVDAGGADTPVVVDTDALNDGSGDADVADGSADAGSSGSGSSGSSGTSGAGTSGSGTSSSSGSGSSGSGSSGSSGSGSGSSGSGAATVSGSSGSDATTDAGKTGSDATTDSGKTGSDATTDSGETDSDTNTGSGTTGANATTDTEGTEVEDGPVEPPPVVVEPPKPAPGIMAGAWKGAVGDQSCLADLSQRDESVTGTITISSEQYQVSGRYNEAKGSIYLTSTTDSNVVFRGTVDAGRVVGKAKLGAGKLYQVWQLRR